MSDDDLHRRLDRIEARLEQLTAALEARLPPPAPPPAARWEDAVAMAADAFDAWAAERSREGMDLDARAASALRVLERLTEPAAASALEEALSLLPRLLPVLRLASTFEDTLAMASDSLDAWAAEQAARGVDLDDRLRAAFALLQTLTDPQIAGVAERLARNLPALEPVAALAGTFEPTTAMLFDMFDEHVRGWQARGIDAESRFQQVAGLVERLTDPVFHGHLEALLDAAPALMAATRTGELFGVAVDEVTGTPDIPAVGPWALLRALSDPDVQRAAGFAVAVARKVGGRLPIPPKSRS